MKPYFYYLFLIFLHFFYASSLAQSPEWANKITNAKHIDIEYEGNTIEHALGPPTLHNPDYIKQKKHDLYADGYIILPNKNRKMLVDFGFKKVTIASKLYIGGLFNNGVIKKAFLILKDNKLKPLSLPTLTHQSRFYSYQLSFPTETVYGVRLIIDHTKADGWNLLKGIGIYKGNDTLQIAPDLVVEHNEFGKKQLLNAYINSRTCAEFNPKTTADGKYLYFVRHCADKKRERIMVCSNNGNDWDAPKELTFATTDKKHYYVAGLPFDASTMYVGEIVDHKTIHPLEGLYSLSKSTDSEWGNLSKVTIPLAYNEAEYENFFISHDQQAMFIVMNQNGGYGDMDIYVSLYNKYKKDWDAPINLGPEINTEFADDFPFLAFDGETLYFSSMGRVGYGGMDIYMSKRLDNTWTKWSTPVNLGPLVNSRTDEFGFTISSNGTTALFSSVTTDNDAHNVDLYQVKLPPSLQQKGICTIEGKIISERTAKPISATIKIKESGKKEWKETYVTTDNGQYTFLLQHGKAYTVQIEADNHYRIEEQLSFSGLENKSVIVKNYKMQPYMDAGQVAVLSNIQFKYSSTLFTDESAPALEKLYNMMKEQKNMVVEFAGHTDDIGTDSFNLKLSRWRAAAVVDYLKAKGIREWRMKFVGYGESRPIAPNDSEEGRALNRRVEMVVIEDDFAKKYQKTPKNSLKSKSKGVVSVLGG